MAAGHCRFSLLSGCSSNRKGQACNSSQAGASISIMLIESPEFIHGEYIKPITFNHGGKSVNNLL